MDKDRDGNVKLQELIDFHKGFNPNTNVYEEAKKMRKMDENMNGTIQFYEYCKYYGDEVKKSTDAHDGKGKSQCCLLI
ncbi:hypothetical protein TVAG_201910 [Trichomonas vaginalis G3]|uniref:EF-hand domain-containing protein n=1 Tax=Trichomonas vaginalis (strain ATCC PRA-98 / G3) TaxID=412133 RepID=A2DWL2_TRIV3|nr:EF-hand family [Trichomonas vaginalis G3]EAY15197.1 hypothetical protein TVAG_201910 [Trichomonas vaginalis G3]KAI5550650.1 EF-hand family [Trichomonas vaginalis G3]|eukprot:XP_001327420.1 hypothetical protein [Trichomonas vaginalis G3]